MERSWKRIISPHDDSESSWSTEDSDGQYSSSTWKRMGMSAKRRHTEQQGGEGASTSAMAPSQQYPNPSDVLMHHDYVGTRSNASNTGLLSSPEDRRQMGSDRFSWSNYSKILACYHRIGRPPIYTGVVDGNPQLRFTFDDIVSELNQRNELLGEAAPSSVIVQPPGGADPPRSLVAGAGETESRPELPVSPDQSKPSTSQGNITEGSSISSTAETPTTSESTQSENAKASHMITSKSDSRGMFPLPSHKTASPGASQQNNNPNEAAEENADSSATKHQESSQDLNELLLGLLECPVCWEVMSPPFRQCRRGHLLCTSCRLRLSSCPTCRTSFTSCRNLAMEKVAEKLKYPCKNSSSGCPVQVVLREKREHEANCRHKLYSCLNPHCAPRWSCKLGALLTHYESRHPTMLLHGARHIISLEHDAHRKSAASLDWIICAYNNLFRVNFHLILSGELYGCVQYIGPQNTSKKYIYELKTELHQDSYRKYVFERTTHSDQIKVEKNYDTNDSFFLSSNWTKRFLSENRLPRSQRKLEISVFIRPV